MAASKLQHPAVRGLPNIVSHLTMTLGPSWRFVVLSSFTTDATLPCVSRDKHSPVFAVCTGLVSGWPLAETVLYPGDEQPRRYLNSFRGEPAIPGLIGLSPPATGHPLIFQHSQAHPPVSVTQPSTCPCIDHRVRVYTLQLNARLRLSVSLRLYTVNLATEYKSPTHYTKAAVKYTGKPCAPTAWCVYVHTVSGSFHPRWVLRLPTVLVHHRSSGVFSLGGWSPIFVTGIPRVPPYYRALTAHVLLCTAVTPYRAPFQTRFH